MGLPLLTHYAPRSIHFTQANSGEGGGGVLIDLGVVVKGDHALAHVSPRIICSQWCIGGRAVLLGAKSPAQLTLMRYTSTTSGCS